MSKNFSVANGKIIDPDGKTFIACGLNISNPAIADQILALFPGVNFIRVAIGSYDDPSVWLAFITQMTGQKIVCEIEHHPWPLQQAGTDLAAKTAWYATWGAAFAANPYVWYGSPNEPQGGNISAEQVAVYNAIRGTGALNMIMLEAGVGGGNPGAVGAAALVMVSYNTMTNVCWDLHFYGWVSPSADQDTINAKLLGAVATATGVLAAQAIRSADGIMPLIVGEVGPSTTGTATDANAAQVIQAVTAWGVQHGYTNGYAGWHWDADPFNALQAGGKLTAWGATLAAAITATRAASAPPPIVASADGTTIGAPIAITTEFGEVWTLTADGLVAVNGVPDTTTANVIKIVYSAGLVCQENKALGWWSKSRASDVWSPMVSGPVVPPPTKAAILAEIDELLEVLIAG